MTKVGTVIAGRYELGEQIGSGGMGEVYRAHDTALQRTVALKLLPPAFSMDEERVRRFLHEARAVSSLNHPNIITIHDVGEGATGCFMATELIDGETLRARMTAAPLTLQETLDIAAQVCAGLAAAHQAGIVHRDIKPENVMLRSDGIVKLLDFGLAKNVERAGAGRAAKDDAATVFSSETDMGLIMGTVTYMSPEQARGLKVDARTDAFSFGVMLYEMVAGHPPFEGGTATDIMVSILEREPPPLRSQARAVPAQLEWIAAKSLDKSPELRYQSIADLRVDLLRLQKAIETGRLIEPAASDAIAAEPAAPELTDADPRVASLSALSRGSFILAAAAVVAAIAVWPLYHAGDVGSNLRVSLPRTAVPLKAREAIAGFGYDAGKLVDNVRFVGTPLRMSDTVTAGGVDAARRAIAEGAVAHWRDVLADERDPLLGASTTLRPGQFAVDFDPSGRLTGFTTPPRDQEAGAELTREEAIAKGEDLIRTRLSIDPRAYDMEFVSRSYPPKVVELTWRRRDLVFGHREVARVEFQGSRLVALERSLHLAQAGSEPPGSPVVKTAAKIRTPVLIAVGVGIYALGLGTFFIRRRWDALVDRLPVAVTVVLALGIASVQFVQQPGVQGALVALVIGMVVAAALLPAVAGLVLWLQRVRPERLYGFDRLVRGRLRSPAAAGALVHGCLGGLVFVALSNLATTIASRVPGFVPGASTEASVVDRGMLLLQAPTELVGAVFLAVLLAVVVESGTRWLRSTSTAIACAAFVFALGDVGFRELTVTAAAAAFAVSLVVGATAAWFYTWRGFGATVVAVVTWSVTQTVMRVWSLGEPDLVFQGNVLVAALAALLALGVWGYVGDKVKQSMVSAAKPA